MRTITDRGTKYQVYSESQLESARAAKGRGEKVMIVRHCSVCGAELFGSNLVTMRQAPKCATH